MIGKMLFYRLQKCILFPVIYKHYELSKPSIFSYMKMFDTVDLAGDGRCDSPGYNAKYGTYTFMLLPSNQIVNFKVTHVLQVANSNALEKYGFLQALEEIENELPVTSITTDRDVQIKAYLKNRADITHQFDVWHMSKSIKKKLFKHSKKYPELTPWIKSIINHFWWCCGTCARDVELLREKWCCILNHVMNKHKWDGNRQFTSCEHGKISQTHAKDVQWLVHGSPAYTCLQSVVMDKTILNDLPYLVEYNYTGMLRVYHALMLKYVPKREHFQLYGMIATTQLAVLDHNYNCNRSQMKTKSGEPRYNTRIQR